MGEPKSSTQVMHGEGSAGTWVSSSLTACAIFLSSNSATLPDKLTFKKSLEFFSPFFSLPSVVNVTKTNRREEGLKYQKG